VKAKNVESSMNKPNTDIC